MVVALYHLVRSGRLMSTADGESISFVPRDETMGLLRVLQIQATCIPPSFVPSPRLGSSIKVHVYDYHNYGMAPNPLLVGLRRFF